MSATVPSIIFDVRCKLQRNAPEDYKLLHEWLLNCIGLQQPVLTLIVHNVSTQSVLLTDVIYHVLKVGQVKDGVTGSVVPDQTYKHTLKHEQGAQHFQLKPPVQIAAQERVAFNLRLFSAEAEKGLVWLLLIEVLATNSDSVTTEPVQIIMGK